ncbi:MAG: peptidase S33 family protein [Nocardioides sp.]|nr:peptidase S33 family protein [Nocardioides sp.]
MRWILVVAAVLVLGIGGGSLTAVLTSGGDDVASPADPATSTGPSAPATPADPGQGDTAPVPAGLEAFYGQQLEWTDCGDSECSELTVPVDYGQPDGDTVDLHLERVPARDQGARVGSLVVNPGGPGAPGSTMTDSADYFFGDALLDRLDVVAFDPRGTGESDPVDCLSDEELDAFLAADPSPDDPGEVEELTAMQEGFFDGCVERSDGLVGHVSTVESARDMDVLRSALDEPTLRYLGFSYGTTLGSTYAQLFPGNVGPFVLDGATDPTLGFEQDALSQAAGFQTALDAYVDDCLTGDCFLGDSREEALTTIEDLLDDIDDSPLPTSSGRDLQIGNAFYGIVYPLYSRDSWTYLDQGLEEALAGSGDTLLLLADLYASRNPDGSYADNSLEAFIAISCLDDPSVVDPAEVPAEVPAFEDASQTFGETFAWGLVGCYGIDVEASEPTPTITAEGAAPIIVIGTTRDPATPYEEAVALAAQLDSGVLVTRDGDGHTGYNKGNACVDDAVETYLLGGDAPGSDLDC